MAVCAHLIGASAYDTSVQTKTSYNMEVTKKTRHWQYHIGIDTRSAPTPEEWICIICTRSIPWETTTCDKCGYYIRGWSKAFTQHRNQEIERGSREFADYDTKTREKSNRFEKAGEEKKLEKEMNDYISNNIKTLHGKEGEKLTGGRTKQDFARLEGWTGFPGC